MEENNNTFQPNKDPVFYLIYKNLLFIIIAAIVCAGIGLGFGFYKVKPVYTASRTVILRASVDNVTYSVSDSKNKNDVALAKRLLPNVVADIKNKRVEEYANERYAGKGKISRGSIATQYSDDSFVFVIKYSDTDEKTVNEKLDAVIYGFNQYLDIDNADYEIIMAKNLRLVELQNRNSDLVKKYNIVLYVTVGAALGIAAAIAFVFIRHALDNTVKSRDVFESLTGVTVISYIDKN